MESIMDIIKKSILMGIMMMFLAISLGAFGAHGLKNIVEGSFLDTYKTGVAYHIYHSLALIILGILKSLYPKINIHLVFKSFLFGILLFSFNCYIYSVTQIKLFAMIIPIGGFSFLFGWAVLCHSFIRKNQ